MAGCLSAVLPSLSYVCVWVCALFEWCAHAYASSSIEFFFVSPFFFSFFYFCDRLLCFVDLKSGRVAKRGVPRHPHPFSRVAATVQSADAVREFATLFVSYQATVHQVTGVAYLCCEVCVSPCRGHQAR